MSKRALASCLTLLLAPIGLGATLACPGSDQADGVPVSRSDPADEASSSRPPTAAAERDPAATEAADDPAEAEDGADPLAGSGADAAASESATVTLPELGLQAVVPAGSKVGDALVGEGVLVQGPGLVVSVEVAPPSRPKTKAAAEKVADRYRPTKVESQRLDDGWAVTYENEGRMGESYFVKVRRKIGDEEYWCEATTAKPEQRANALEFCRSLDRAEPKAEEGSSAAGSEAPSRPSRAPSEDAAPR